MSNGTVMQFGKVYRIECHGNDAFKNDIKAFPDRKWKYPEKYWEVPVIYHARVKELAKAHSLDFHTETGVEPVTDFTIPPLPELSIEIKTKRSLLPWQASGIAYSLEKQRLISGDDMGLGKTTQAIVTIEGLNQLGKDAYPCLIICPSAVKENWVKEIKANVHRTGIVLKDSVKNTFPEFFRVGMSQFFIVNYESLKKYFVDRIDDVPAGKQLRLEHIHFKQKYLDFFKAVIVDESHKCFPYNTKILTSEGWLQIGEIVENKMDNLLIASCNTLSKSITYNKINNFFKNELSTRKVYCVKHSGGKFYATEDHKVFTETGRYKMVSEINSGEGLYLLRNQLSSCESRQENCQQLFQKLRIQDVERKNSSDSNSKSSGRKRMRMVQRKVFNSTQQSKQVLRSELFSSVENVTSGIYQKYQYRSEEPKRQCICETSDQQSGCYQKSIRKDEVEQSDGIGRNQIKGICQPKRQAVSYQTCGQRRINSSTTEVKRSFRPTGIEHGVSNKYGISSPSFRQNSKLLQVRHSNSRNHAFNRGRRNISQSLQSERCGCVENKSLELVRVDSVEVYKQGSDEQFDRGYINREYVYDIEVDVNHNYFAEGILVSNCKSIKAQNTKFTKGICIGKETILLLTGTPIVNKPMDLVSQLGILGRMGDFGGYKGFVKRYCSGPKEASNLKELNYKLNMICFYRRNKTDPDIKKYLPDKMRQVIQCELDPIHRKEYGHAQADLESYLVNVKKQSDESAAASMKGEVMVRIGILKNISARGKLKDAFSFIQDIIDNGQKIVVFASLRDVIGQVQEKFPNSVRVTGAEDGIQKQAAVDRFQNDPKINVIVLNLKAGGVGINGLQNVSTQICFIEFGWHAAVMDQAEDRLYRTGQHNNVMCTYFLGKNTIDEWSYEMINSKREIANTVTGSEDVTEETFIDSVMSLFSK